MNTTRTRFSLCLALVAGCTDDAASGDLALADGDVAFRCPFCCQTCDTNSPRVNDYGIPELNIDGLDNDDGVRLIALMSPSAVPYQVGFHGDDIVAKDTMGDVVAGQVGLVGWYLWLKLPAEVDFVVQVRGYRRDIASMATGAAPITGYALSYFDTDSNEWANVCPGAALDSVVATLIVGETYDRQSKTVNPGMTGWFTIACAEEAAYKMKLMNYSPNADFDGDGNPATWQQRQATIKMITADYCGDGTAYTEQGTAIHWQNYSLAVDSYPYAADPGPRMEARWDENGALCLGEPRLGTVDPEEIGCTLPSCLGGGETAHEWATWTPDI